MTQILTFMRRTQIIRMQLENMFSEMTKAIAIAVDFSNGPQSSSDVYNPQLTVIVKEMPLVKITITFPRQVSMPRGLDL